MSVHVESQSISCGNIRFTSEKVCELDGNTVILSIPKQEIANVSVAFGRSVERPLARIMVGLVLCFTGLLLGVWPLYKWFTTHDTSGLVASQLKPFAFAAPLVLIGLWLLMEVFRRSHYLLLETHSGMRRVPLGECSPSEVLVAANNLGYPVDFELSGQ